MKTDLCHYCGHCWVFQICWQIGCSTLTASSFRILPSVLVKVPSRGRAKSLLESPGRTSGEGWSQGWRTPKSVDPLAALGPICCPYGLPPGQALAPAFPHLWLLGVYCPAPTSLVAQRGASSALQSPAPLCQLLGTLIATLWPPPPWSLRICFLCHRCLRPLKPCYHEKE